MIWFDQRKKGLFLIYSPETNDGAWVLNRLRTDGRVRISGIFWFEPDDLLSPKGVIALQPSDDFDDEVEEFRFRFATATSKYFRIPGERLGIANDVKIARDAITINRKTFVAERNINIFRKLAELKEDGSPIVVGGTKEGAIPPEIE